ncbi:serine/threonine-protein kinase bsk2 [Quercus suber]|uniref:Serine/threonine-protein kinase bsk2 n=1 Tax=Quercus suber TaxID=58331 RepID=A0AAW0KJE4_QUESU
MGCFQSKTAHLASPDQDPPLPHPSPDPGVRAGRAESSNKWVSSELIVSESGEKAPNVVYKGKLRNNGLLPLSASLSSPGLTHISLWG